jgi:hypothetical protein
MEAEKNLSGGMNDGDACAMHVLLASPLKGSPIRRGCIRTKTPAQWRMAQEQHRSRQRAAGNRKKTHSFPAPNNTHAGLWKWEVARYFLHG